MTSYATLRPCPACQRHVRFTDRSCPFCAEALPVQTAPKLADISRLSRSERVLFAAAVAAVSLPACGGAAQEPQPPPPVVAPAYGVPAPPPEENTDGEPGEVPPEEGMPVEPAPETGQPQDPGAVRPLYGVPPPPE